MSTTSSTAAASGKAAAVNRDLDVDDARLALSSAALAFFTSRAFERTFLDLVFDAVLSDTVYKSGYYSKIEAVKSFRALTLCSLVSAKEFVEGMEKLGVFTNALKTVVTDEGWVGGVDPLRVIAVSLGEPALD